MRWRVAAMAAASISLAGCSYGHMNGGNGRIEVGSGVDWLHHGGDPTGSRYSSLRQITADNVHLLEVAWSAGIDAAGARLEATPIVVNGTIYVTAPWSVVTALDARTGATRWTWDPGVGRLGAIGGDPVFCCGPVNRGVAVADGRVFVGLLDGRLAALDAATGRPIWVRQTVPEGSSYTITGAPIVISSLVVIGNGGADLGVRGFVAAYAVDTGEEVWRFYTVPGNPSDGFENAAMESAAGTWSGEWWRLGGGGTVWDALTHDAETNTLFVGTGNGSPWSRDHRSGGQGDNLYLASILALDADSGGLRWYYQTTPGEEWDYTATQNLVLAELVIEGRTRPVVMQASKNGFFYVLDRMTGDVLAGDAYARVTWASGVDLLTGRPIETDAARYGKRGAWVSPGPQGARTWAPMAWSPMTELMYIPGQNTVGYFRVAETFDPIPGRHNSGLAGGRRPSPPPQVDPPGFLSAWDPVMRMERWRVSLETQRNGGVLATAGNLVFAASSDGVFKAYNSLNGSELWVAELGGGPGSPVTFMVGDAQHLAVLSGDRLWVFRLPARVAEVGW